MFNSTSLLNNHEFKSFARVTENFPDCKILDISQVETFEFRECLGVAFYAQLKEDLAVYTYSNYAYKNAAGQVITHPIGTIVSYEGKLRRATKATQNNPSLNTDWEDLPKFTTPCYENLWCIGSLGLYLSLCVKKLLLPESMAEESAAGLVERSGLGFKAASTKKYQIKADGLAAQISIVWENLDAYMKDNNSTNCFDNYKGIANTCCGTCGNSNTEDCDNCTCESGCTTSKKYARRSRVV